MLRETQHGLRFGRLTEWWRPKAGVLVSLLLFFLALHLVDLTDGLKLILYSIITLSGFAVTGYVLNDWSDILSDRQVGKSNSMEGLPIVVRGLVLIAALTVTAFPWVYFFPTSKLSLILIVVQLSLLVAYPIPPLRLKRYPFAAIVVDALYAFTVPALLAWHTFDLTFETTEPASHFALVALAIWMFSKGIRQILNHHVSDRIADKKTATPNMALKFEPSVLRSVNQNYLFPIELLACLFFLAFLDGSTPFFNGLIFFAAAIAGYRQLSPKRSWFNVSFHETRLDRFSTFWLGFLSALFLTSVTAGYGWVAVGFLFLFTNLIYHPILRVIGSKLYDYLKFAMLFPFQLASLAFNWALYYFRKWVLGWSEEKNWGEHYDKRLHDLATEKRKANGVVAVFNQNYNKYTETFVRGHLQSSQFHVISFHGWPSPMHVGDMESLISEFEFIQKGKYLIWKLLNLDVKQKENELIAKRLIDENASVILAEFGTMGNRVLEVSKMTGIPLITVFYGYDAWHKTVLEEQQYAELFAHAARVVGVSNDICQQLIQLGCPEEKVTYLPCYVNTELFKPVERDFSQPHILAVGRFAVTKAPELTILAFNEMLNSISDATLTMVGADDDNATFESSMSLIKALGIEDKVQLKGKLLPEEVYRCMQEASLFVQHSVTTPVNGDKEGTPVAVMEALASGLPVVSTKHAGIQEVITNGENGILVDEFDFRSMAAEMAELLSNKEKLQSISSAAVESVRNNLDIQNHTQKMEDILRQAMSSK